MVIRKIVYAGIVFCFASIAVPAAALVFNSGSFAGNAAQRTAWLAAIGVAPANLVDFESGYVDGQNISGTLLGPGFFLKDTSAGNTVSIECGNSTIGGSNPIGTCAAEHNESQFLVFDFTANPVDYVGFYDIDHTEVTNGGTIFFVGGATQSFTLETTSSGGNIEEFFGVARNDMARIERLQIDVGGDGQWAVDNIQYGQEQEIPDVPEPATLVMAGTGLALAAILRRFRDAKRG
jgi:hypothetical protein